MIWLWMVLGYSSRVGHAYQRHALAQPYAGFQQQSHEEDKEEAEHFCNVGAREGRRDGIRQGHDGLPHQGKIRQD